MDSDRNEGGGIPPSNEPPFQAVSPNLDRFSRSSLAPGTLSRRRIVRTGIALGALLLAIVAGVSWWIALG
ncbi:hypothetical protein M3147_15075 [Agromyces mediolanus]|uniref:hypothetical protein n=1 Tax=Agromyces mediolanus TaxID=41986 RepID=UPI00203F643E|nr:hypothetical protein [Agromyces mediolanus]MCM3658577.1 hypothetical protein [Agromyces mediolanus]